MKKLILSAVFLCVSLAHAQIVENRVDLFSRRDMDTRNRTPEQIHADNLSLITRFTNMNVDDRNGRMVDYEKAKYIRFNDAAKVLNASEANPVVSLSKTRKYDPQNKGIGFCFGRAMFVHIELIYRGLDRDSIKKAIVVGSMGKGTWGWHVTTIAQSKDRSGREQWLAIDPVAGRVMPLQDWYNYWRNGDSDDKKLKLYIAENTRFGAGASWYDDNGIRDPFYNNYFIDLMRWFEDQSKAGAYNVPLTEM